MKYSFLLAFGVLLTLISGCAHEAYYADREHVVASSDAFDKMIVHKDHKYAGMPVEGIDAIYIENVMGRYLETFTEGLTKEDIDTSEAGFTGE